jgi:hypothetical protein
MRKRTVAEDINSLSEEEAQIFLDGRLALFRADVVGSQAHERYALLVAGFSGAVLTSLGLATKQPSHVRILRPRFYKGSNFALCYGYLVTSP